MTSKNSTKRTQSTRELIKHHALVRGDARSLDVRVRVEAAIKQIEEETKSNGGTYPRNNGVLSSAEIARRAGVHPTTFFTPKQRELGAEVRKWLASLNARESVGSTARRRPLSERVDEWARQYAALCQSFRIVELELQQSQHQLERAEGQLKTAEAEIERLREILRASGTGNVVTLRSSKD